MNRHLSTTRHPASKFPQLSNGTNKIQMNARLENKNSELYKTMQEKIMLRFVGDNRNNDPDKLDKLIILCNVAKQIKISVCDNYRRTSGVFKQVHNLVNHQQTVLKLI